jgi:hypothetical protein
VADQDGRDAPLIWYIDAGIILFACFRLARCVWILTKLIDAFAPPLDPSDLDD